MATSDILLSIGIDTAKLKAIAGQVQKEIALPVGKISPEAQKGVKDLSKSVRILSQEQLQVAKSSAHVTNAVQKQGLQAKLTTSQQTKFKDTLSRVRKEEELLGKTTLPMVTSRVRTLSAMKAKGMKLTAKEETLLKGSAEQMSKTAKSIDDVHKSQGRGIKSMAKWALGWTILYSGIRLVQNIITDIIGTYGQLDDTMARVATVTRAVGESQEIVLRGMRDAVLDYGSTSRAEFIDVGKTLYFLGSAGLSVNQQMVGFEHTMDLIIGTVGKVDQGARLVAGAFNVFGKNIKGAITDAERFKAIADILAYTYSNQQVELNEIAAAFQLVGSAAGILEIGFKELVGTIGFLNTGMLKGTRAGTSLMNAFIKVSQNAHKLRTILGITFDPTKPMDFVNIMGEIYEAIGSTTVSTEQLKMLMDIFGLRGARAVANIINRFDTWKDTVDASQATFANFAALMREEMEDTLPAALKELGNSIKANMIKAMEPFLENLKDVIDRINKINRTAAEAKELQEILDMMADKPAEGLEDLKGWPKAVGAIGKIFQKIMPFLFWPIKPIGMARKEWEKFIEATKETIEIPFNVQLFKELGLPEIIKEAAENTKALVNAMTPVGRLSKRYRDFILEAAKTGKDELQIKEDLTKALAKATSEEEARQWAAKGWLDLLIKAVLKEEELVDTTTKLLKLDQQKLFSLKEAHTLRVAGIRGLEKEEILQKELASRIQEIAFNLKNRKEIQETLNTLFFEEKNISDETIYLEMKKYGLHKEILKLLELRYKITEETHKKARQIAEVFETEISKGMWDVIQRTGTWLDMIKNIGDELMQMSIKEVVKKIIVRPIFDVASEKMTIAGFNMNTAADKHVMAASAMVTAAQIQAGSAIDLGEITVRPTPSPPTPSGSPEGGTSAAPKTFGGLSAGQWIGAGAAAYSIYQGGMGPGRGAMAGGMMGMQMGGPWGAAIGVVAGGLLGLLGQGKRQEKATTDQTKVLATLLTISNRSMNVINRNLVALREARPPYPMAESAYFASAAQRGFIGA